MKKAGKGLRSTVAKFWADATSGNPSEKELAIELANKILDRPFGDPDDDLAVLSRQFLRALERLGEYRPPDDETAA